jgi:hypothetical protein
LLAQFRDLNISEDSDFLIAVTPNNADPSLLPSPPVNHIFSTPPESSAPDYFSSPAFPGAFAHSTPRHSPLPTAFPSTLSSPLSSVPSAESSSSTPSLTSLILPSSFSLISPALVNPLSIAAQPQPFIDPLSITVPANNPAEISQMAANPISMPLRGTRDAPKFDGKTAAQLPRFLEDVEILGDAAGITEEAMIKAAIRYADLEEAEVWETLDAASGVDWADFVTAVKDLYPGCEGASRFCRADLQYLVYEYSKKPMRSQDDLGEYRRKFIKISAHLVTAKKLAETERDALFLSGFPQEVAERVRHRLSIVKSDLHPDDAYPIEDVMKAAKFLLTGSALRAPIPALNEYRSIPPSVPQPPTGSVVKQEYAFQSQRPVGRPSVCAFCADHGHFIGSCDHVQEYLQAGKIIRGTDGRLYMPDGSGIPRYPGTNCMKVAIDRMEAERRGSTPVATSAAFV